MNATLTERTKQNKRYVEQLFSLHFSLLLAWSVRPLQYFCKSTKNKLLLWKKMYSSNNAILYSLSRYVLSQFVAVASQYGVRSVMQSKGVIKSAIWMSFAETLTSSDVSTVF